MTTAETTSEAKHARPAPPRLRIHHLMACTFVAAILLTLWRYEIPAKLVGQLPLSIKLYSSIGVGLFAIELTFALLTVYWHLKGYAALVHPGQWLLVQSLISFAQMLIGQLLLSHLRVTGPWGKSFALWSQSDKFLAVVSAMCIVAVYLNRALPALFYGWCAWRVADTRLWRIFFSLKALLSLVSFLPLYSMIHLLRAGMVFSSIVMLSLLIWIIATEYRRQARYWTHWLGVGLCVATTVLEFASGVMNWLGWY